MHALQKEAGILFVCTGNTCRSPLAEAVAQQVLERLGRSARVHSAGTAAVAGAAASAHSLQVAAEAGLDLAAHRARPLTRPMLDAATLVLAMGAEHLRVLRAMAPHAAAHLLAEYAGSDAADVPDPIGGDLEAYRRTFHRIRTLVESSMGRFHRGVERERI